MGRALLPNRACGWLGSPTSSAWAQLPMGRAFLYVSSLTVDSIGVSTGRELKRLVSGRRSRTYFWCDKKIDSLTRAGNLNPKKVTKGTQIFSVKMLSKMPFQISNSCRITLRENNIIHINNQYSGTRRKMANKERVIISRTLEAICNNNGAESIKPSTWRLF